jgi:hypothetical protein
VDRKVAGQRTKYLGLFIPRLEILDAVVETLMVTKVFNL